MFVSVIIIIIIMMASHYGFEPAHRVNDECTHTDTFRFTTKTTTSSLFNFLNG